MKQEVFINVLPHEVRAAVSEDGTLVEVHIERQHQQHLLGRIYKARVKRVMPGMQAAFVEFGAQRAGFLHIKDLAEFKAHEVENLNDAWLDCDIRDYMKEGDDLFVQVHKNPMGTKGARLTTQLSIVSHYLVMIPNAMHVGVSLRIDDEGERQRLLGVIEEPAHGYIFRTASIGIDAERLLEDKAFLEGVWQDVHEKMRYAKSLECIHKDLPLLPRIIRDVAQYDCDGIYIDCHKSMEEVRQFATRSVPGLTDKIYFYEKHDPIFYKYSIEKQLSRALMRQVPLPSGGYLVIDQTEAMTVIDVNSGGYVGKLNLEETAFNINLEAADVLVKQLRLRNIAGIIIVDFIDMKSPDHQDALLAKLESCLAYDTAKCRLSEVTSLGLVQITRRRVRNSLQKVLCEDCPTCQASGFVYSPESVAHAIFRKLLSFPAQEIKRGVTIKTSKAVWSWFMEHEPELLKSLEALVGNSIALQSSDRFRPEQFDIGIDS